MGGLALAYNAGQAPTQPCTAPRTCSSDALLVVLRVSASFCRLRSL